MKAHYEAERGMDLHVSSDERIIEADLFGEGEWITDSTGASRLAFQRGVATYPSPQQTVYLTPKAELRFIYGDAKGVVIRSNKNKKDHENYNKILRKLESLIKDERLAFMMKNWNGNGDSLPSVLGQFFDNEPETENSKAKVKIVDLSGVPNEVVDTASAAIARTIFSLKIWQTPEERKFSPVLLVCEEAHRYVPNKGEAQYEAA